MGPGRKPLRPVFSQRGSFNLQTLILALLRNNGNVIRSDKFVFNVSFKSLKTYGHGFDIIPLSSINVLKSA